MVTVQVERLKLFTHQSQKKGLFPIPHYEPWSLWACPVGIRIGIAGSQGPIPLLYDAEDPG